LIARRPFSALPASYATITARTVGLGRWIAWGLATTATRYSSGGPSISPRRPCGDARSARWLELNPAIERCCAVFVGMMEDKEFSETVCSLWILDLRLRQSSQRPDESTFQILLLTTVANDGMSIHEHEPIDPFEADGTVPNCACGFFQSCMRMTEVLSRGWANCKARRDD